MSRLVLIAPDISCARCKEHIEGDLSPIAGIQRVEVVVETKEVLIDHDESVITEEALRSVMAEIGYPVAE
jgi:copper chaperone